MSDVRRLKRKRKGKVLMGLCAGLGEYFNIDPLILRLGFVCGFIILPSGLAILLFYFIASLLVPYGESDETSEKR